MDARHYNELIQLSQEIYDQATDKLTNYCASKYCGIANDTMEDQLQDYLFVAEETSAFLLGNALALLTPESQEKEIRDFISNLQRVIALQQKNSESDIEPS